MSPEHQPPPRPGGSAALPRAIDRLNDLVGRAVLWLVAVMVAIGAYNAVARYLNRFTDANLASNAYLEAQWYLFSLVFLLGAAYALKEDAHVRVDVLYGRLGPRGRAWIDLLGTVLFLIPFCVLMLWVSWPSVAASWRVREVSPDPGGLPRYPIKAVVLVAFALLLLQGVSQLWKQVALLRGAAPPPEPGHHRPEEV
jgi:TRAP-type mannitol/chloroaromatic compound transport system permease small subunit